MEFTLALEFTFSSQLGIRSISLLCRKYRPVFARRYFQKQKRHMDFYFHAPYAIIKYLIKAVLVTAPAHVAPGLLKWFVWYQTVKICYHYSISTVYRHYLPQGIPPFLHPYTAFLR